MRYEKRLYGLSEKQLKNFMFQVYGKDIIIDYLTDLYICSENDAKKEYKEVLTEIEKA